MNSQILTGIEKVHNEAITILEGMKCIFFLSCMKDGFFFEERGTGGLMVGLQSQQQTKTFVVCQIWKFIALFVNTSRSVDKPHEARSGRATYLKAESSKIRMNPFR